jgi:hypothetical protein
VIEEKKVLLSKINKLINKRKEEMLDILFSEHEIDERSTCAKYESMLCEETAIVAKES